MDNLVHRKLIFGLECFPTLTANIGFLTRVNLLVDKQVRVPSEGLATSGTFTEFLFCKNSIIWNMF